MSQMISYINISNQLNIGSNNYLPTKQKLFIFDTKPSKKTLFPIKHQLKITPKQHIQLYNNLSRKLFQNKSLNFSLSQPKMGKTDKTQIIFHNSKLNRIMNKPIMKTSFHFENPLN